MEQGWGKLAALFSVTSICDFIAMCMMMIGSGSQRIEDLKKAIRGKDKAGIFKTAANDRAYLLTGIRRRSSSTRSWKPGASLRATALCSTR